MTNQNWRERLLVHPAADLMPLMTEEDLRALSEDIRKNGLKEKIKLFIDSTTQKRRFLVDGRNRLNALEMIGGHQLFDEHGNPELSYFQYVGVSPRDAPGSDFDPYAYVSSLNVRRRHLTGEQKRDSIAKLLMANPEQSNRQTAKMVGADDKTVGKVRAELEATAEIPQLRETTGADGKNRPTRKLAKSKSQQVAAVEKVEEQQIAPVEPEPKASAKHQASVEPVVPVEPEVPVEPKLAERTRLEQWLNALYGPLTLQEWKRLGIKHYTRARGRGQHRHPGGYSDLFLKLVAHHKVPGRWDR